MVLNNTVPSEVTEDSVTATMVDFVELVKANPSLELPLVNIIQKRLLAEAAVEIASLKNPSKD